MSQIVKGEDKSFEVTIRQSVNGRVTDPYDLTSKTVKLAYKNTSGTLVEITATILNAVLGKIQVDFTDTQSSELKAGDFKFDLLIDEGADRSIIPVSGKINIVTRNS